MEVYDVTEGERPPHYLEMEYVDGPRLRDWLATEPPLSDRLEVVAQIADALDVVHAAGIFHRDIKPANILLTRREDGALRAKLSDFGLGAAQDPEFLKSISDSRVSGCVGTWDYIAPEVRHGRPASAQSDLYSLGLTLYQIVVSDLDRPLTGDWESQVPTDVLREDLGKCVCQDPATRWAEWVRVGPCSAESWISAARTNAGPTACQTTATGPPFPARGRAGLGGGPVVAGGQCRGVVPVARGRPSA